MIRVARIADSAEVLRLWLALFPDDGDAQQDIASLIAGKQRAALFVAEREGGLGGFLEVGTRPYAEGCETSPVAYVEAWYVDPDLRRQGLGRALFAAAEQWDAIRACAKSPATRSSKTKSASWRTRRWAIRRSSALCAFAGTFEPVALYDKLNIPRMAHA